MIGSGGESSSQGNFSLPSGPNLHPSQPSSSSHPPKKKNWSSRSFPFRSSSKSNRVAESGEQPQQQSQQQNMTRQQSIPAGSGSSAAPADRWWKMHLFQGMVKDIRRRAPYYWSDWADAWDYRVVPATVYMYFAKYDPENATIFLTLFSPPFFLQRSPIFTMPSSPSFQSSYPCIGSLE